MFPFVTTELEVMELWNTGVGSFLDIPGPKNHRRRTSKKNKSVLRVAIKNDRVLDAV